jgi:hypothetical protein
MADYPTITLGDRQVQLGSFSARKAMIAGRVIRRLAEAAPAISREQAEFEKKYAEELGIDVTHAMVLGSAGWQYRLGHVTDEEWTQLGGVIRLPGLPSERESRLVQISAAFEHAGEPLTMLVGLAVAANSELVAAAKEGHVEKLLLDRGNELVDIAGFGEILELLAAAIDLVEAELAEHKDPFDKVRAAIGLGEEELPEPPTPVDTSESQEETEASAAADNREKIERAAAEAAQDPEAAAAAMAAAAIPTPSDVEADSDDKPNSTVSPETPAGESPSGTSPTSSTSSPPPTTGPPETSSTDSGSATSLASAT